jgi:eukaryotic-like serine/threonine-protein kinase
VLTNARNNSLAQDDQPVDSRGLLRYEFAVPNHQIHRTIGRGSSSTVYEATHLVAEDRVAVKVLSPPPVNQLCHDMRERRFIAEARLARSLVHPNLVPVYEVGRTIHGQPFFSMQLQSYSLSDWLNQHQTLMPAELYLICTSIINALVFMHERTLLHLDVRPSNVMLNNQGQPNWLLGDMGLTAEIGGHLRPGAGTYGYCSPEMLRGEPASPRSDIFSFCILLRELLSATTLPSKESSRFTDVVRRGTDPNPQVRPLTMRQVFLELSDHSSWYQHHPDRAAASQKSLAASNR